MKNIRMVWLVVLPAPFFSAMSISSQYSDLKRAIIKNPEQVLLQAEETLQRAERRIALNLHAKEITDVDDSVRIWNEWIDQYACEMPILLLSECGKMKHPYVKPVALSRKHNPLARAMFEEKAAACLEQKMKTNRIVQYVGFGSGQLFQDFVTVTKALNAYPLGMIAIHLIDVLYAPYVKAVDFFKDTHEIKSTTCIVFDEQFPLYYEHLNKDRQGDQIITEKAIKFNMQILSASYKQYITTLQKMFPFAGITLHVHDSAKNYSRYIKAHAIPVADFINAVDICGTEDLKKKSYHHYRVLVEETFKDNKYVTDLALDNTFSTHHFFASLITFIHENKMESKGKAKIEMLMSVRKMSHDKENKK